MSYFNDIFNEVFMNNSDYPRLLSKPPADSYVIKYCGVPIIANDDNGFYIPSSSPLMPQIDRVIFNDPATIIFFKDGTKTVVKCDKEDTYNKEVGFCFAYLKRIFGNKYIELLKDWVWD